MSTDIPGANWSCFTPPDQLQHPHCPAVVSPSIFPSPLANADRPLEPPLLSSSSSSSSSFPVSSAASTSAAVASAMPINTTHNPDTTQTPAPPPSTPVMRTWSIPVLIALAPSPHISAWWVTCESIAQRLANQCLEHQPTPAAFASTVLAHPCTAWAYSAKCTSTETCGSQPPGAPHHHILPHQHLTAHQYHPPQAPNCHFPCNWEVCFLAPSPCGSLAACVIGI
ncbi:hypothetical protein SprV_0501889800 [Sparganum proliferum]